MLTPRPFRLTTSLLLFSTTTRRPQFTSAALLRHSLSLQRRQRDAMAIHMQGRCVCEKLQYSLQLDTPDDARTTLCHCRSCRRAFGTNYGLTAKVPVQAFKYESGCPKTYKQKNGVTREFCDSCGAYICEYGEEAADKFRYIMWGSLDEPEKIPPKGEFFCKNRPAWMPEIPGLFHKKEIKE